MQNTRRSGSINRRRGCKSDDVQTPENKRPGHDGDARDKARRVSLILIVLVTVIRRRAAGRRRLACAWWLVHSRRPKGRPAFAFPGGSDFVRRDQPHPSASRHECTRRWTGNMNLAARPPPSRQSFWRRRPAKQVGQVLTCFVQLGMGHDCLVLAALRHARWRPRVEVTTVEGKLLMTLNQHFDSLHLPSPSRSSTPRLASWRLAAHSGSRELRAAGVDDEAGPAG